MRVHVLQHVPFEGLGSIDSWLRERGARVTSTRFYESVSLPDPERVDLIIILGGPMSANDEDRHPWLVEEKKFVGHAVRSERAVLGICLGAQMIASALGAPVYAGPHKEIGWFGIEATRAPAGAFAFPRSLTVFHWHGETFDLPRSAARQARSAGCENQAFQLGPNVIGLQFHLETTAASADALISNCRHELVAGAFIQTEVVMRSVPAAFYTVINRHMDNVLEYLSRGVLG
jgi:GMP synthase-like glutamine amidotransferase